MVVVIVLLVAVVFFMCVGKFIGIGPIHEYFCLFASTTAQPTAATRTRGSGTQETSRKDDGSCDTAVTIVITGVVRQGWFIGEQFRR